MKLVLVAGFNTRTVKNGPNVLLAAGKWRILSEHHNDSILTLTQNGASIDVKHGTEFVTTDKPVFLGVRIPGSEPYINVFAEPI